MRCLVCTVTLLLTACPLHAGFVGFEVFTAPSTLIASTGGVVRVNYMGNKTHSISLGSTRLTLMEVQLTLASGEVKRNTMLFVGNHALRVPLSIELTGVLAAFCVLSLVGGLIITLSFPFRLAEQQAGADGNQPVRQHTIPASAAAGSRRSV